MSNHLLWQYLDKLPAQSAAWCDWNSALGQWNTFPEFQKRYLQLNKGKAMAVNCKSNCCMSCPRKVVEHASDDIVAVCPEQEDRPYPLNPQDILVHSLRRGTFHRDLCSALKITHRESKEPDCRHTWRIGEYVPEAGSVFPAFITFQQEPGELTEVTLNLCMSYEKPFTVIAPTRRLLTPRAEQLLEKRNALFIAMSDEVTFSDKGILQVKRPATELFARFQKEIPKQDSGGMVHFPTPAGISWEAVTIHFVDGHTVSIRAGEAHGRYNYTQLGMVNKKNSEPTAQWKLLLGFADAQGSIDWKSSVASNNLKAQKRSLSKRLRNFFRLENDPIEWIKTEKCYRCRFRILPDNIDA